MLQDRISDRGRRNFLKMAGISATAAGVLTQTQPTRAQSADASLVFNDQKTPGHAIRLAKLQTDRRAHLQIRSSSSGGRHLRTAIEPGTNVRDKTIEVFPSIPETQQVNAFLRDSSAAETLASDEATVTVTEPIDEAGLLEDIDPGPGVRLIESDPDAGFHFPYFLYTPDPSHSIARNGIPHSDALDTRSLIVGFPPRGGLLEARLESAQNSIEGRRLRRMADELFHPALVATLPISPIDASFRVLDRNSLQFTEPPYERHDLQVLAMVADARERLKDENYQVADTIHLDGFSTSGRFVDQFTILHPERVIAVSGGGNGSVRIPKTKLDDDIPTFADPHMERLPWPVGVADLDELIGKEFNKEAWLETAQFRYIGAEDQGELDDDSLTTNYVHSPNFGHFGDELQQLALEIFGPLQVDHRFKTTQAIFENVGVAGETRIYDGFGHNAFGEISDDIITFHREQVHAEFGPLFVRTIEWPDDPVPVGESTTIAVSYENMGASEAVATSTLRVEGQTVATDEVRVASHDAEQVEFEHAFDSTGEYSVSIDDRKTEQIEVIEETFSPSEFVEDEHANVAWAIGVIGSVGYLTVYAIKQQLSDSE